MSAFPVGLSSAARRSLRGSRALASVALAVSVLASCARAQCLEWAPGFGLDLIDGGIAALVVHDDGSGPALYAGGSFTTIDGVPSSGIARWDGASWSALVGGVSGGGAWTVRALASFDDGSGPALYAGGSFTTAGGVPASGVARWDGASWSPLDLGTNGSVAALAVWDDGTGPALYAGGSFTQAGGVTARHLARWDGQSWSEVGGGITPGANTWVYAIAAYDDGSGPGLYVAGSFTAAGGVAALKIARWDGTGWSALGTGIGSGVAYALHVHDDGSGPALYVGGNLHVVGGLGVDNAARWNGSAWSPVGDGPGDGGGVYALGSYDSGSGPELWAGGMFNPNGNGPIYRIARWNGVQWFGIGTGADHSVNAFAVYDDGAGRTLYIGGAFDRIDDVPSHGLARWDGSGIAPWVSGNGVDKPVAVLAPADVGSGPALYAGGAFDHAGATPASRIAAWNGQAWSALGSGVELSFYPPNTAVEAIAVRPEGGADAVYVGGIFDTAGGVFAGFAARWDGANWSGLGIGTNSPVHALAFHDDGSGSALYAGGAFSEAGGASALYAARWDGSAWSPVGGGFDDDVLALAVYDDGSGPALFAAGTFTQAGGALIRGLARWDGATWSAVGGGIDGFAFELAVHDDGSGPALYVGGGMTTAGGVAVARVARWDGATWSAVGIPPNGTVHDLVSHDDGFGPALYVAATYGLARWDGASWSSLGAGPSDQVFALASWDDGLDGDADLFVGGVFQAAGGQPSKRFGKWDGCGAAPTAFCFGDGSVAPCPCANAGLAGRGCDNSAATGGARLDASGGTQPDTLVLSVAHAVPSSLALFLQGSQALTSTVPFGDGLRCASGNLLRLFAKDAASGGASAPGPGDPSISARSAALGDPIPAGAMRFYQVFYRDPALGFCPPPAGSSFNVSNGVRAVW